MFVTICDDFLGKASQMRVYSKQEDGQWEYKGWSMADDKKLTKVTWAPLNKFVITGDETGMLRLHDPSNNFEVSREISHHSKRINSLQWNLKKTLLITGSADQKSKLLDPVTWEVLKTYETEVPVNSAAISPIKEHVLVAGGQEAMNVTTTSSKVGKFETKFFHMVFGDEFGSVKGHFGPVNCIAIHPQGTGFTSGAEDGYIRIHEFDKSYFSFHAELDDVEALKAA